jgi:MtaA/CmuA family methyltransferase
MGKQDVIDAVKGLPTQKVPWVPYAGVHCAYLIGESADKYLQDPDLIAKGVMYAAKRYRADGIPLLFDLTVEAISMGCAHKWWSDNSPSITGHPLDNKSLAESGIRIPGPKDGRWPVIIEAGKKVKAEMPDVALYGILCGPLTLASHLRGVRIFTDVYKNKALAKEIIDFCGEVAGEAARIYTQEIGCDVIAITDPVSSQIKPETFRELVTPATQPAIRATKKAGKVSSFFICGDATKVLEEVAQVGTDGFAIDEQLNLTYVRDVARKYGVGFGGNLKLTLALSLGILSPREDAIVALAAGGSTGFVFAPG